MATYISLLRAVNVGGTKKILMEELKQLYESLQFTKVRTYIQSGNVLFDSSSTDVPAITKKIEEKLKKTLGAEVSVIIWTPKEMQAIIDKSPFKKATGKKLYVTFLSALPDKIKLKEMEKITFPDEQFAIIGKDIHLCYEQGYGNAKLMLAFFEKKLGVRGTTRNWNSVNKLYELTLQP